MSKRFFFSAKKIGLFLLAFSSSTQYDNKRSLIRNIVTPFGEGMNTDKEQNERANERTNERIR